MGLPSDAFMFYFYGPEPDPLPTLPQDWAESQSHPRHAHLWHGDEQLPTDAEYLVMLGGLVHDFSVLIDGRTGALFCTETGADHVIPVHADLSTLSLAGKTTNGPNSDIHAGSAKTNGRVARDFRMSRSITQPSFQQRTRQVLTASRAERRGRYP